MYSIRTNGDIIAQEFTRLLGNSLNIKKVAQEAKGMSESDASGGQGATPEGGSVVHDEADDHAVDVLANEAFDNVSDYSDADLKDLLVEPTNEVYDSAADSVDDAIDGISAFSTSADPAGHYIMNGLGKIAGSLRGKGEAFAADVVEATALSIRGDLVKEANRKAGIVSALNKMASDFSSNGDSFAADMVKVTINKISR